MPKDTYQNNWMHYHLRRPEFRILKTRLPTVKMLLGICKKLHLSELVNVPTRISNDNHTFRLDLILTNSPTYFKDTSAVLFSGSHHHLISMQEVLQNGSHKK